MELQNQYENLFNDSSKCLSQEQLKLYVQNILSPVEKRLVENHLLECEFCSDAVEGLKQINSTNYQQAIDLINRQIKRRVKYSSRKNIFYSPWKIIAVAASVLFLVLLSGIYFDWFLHTRFENVAKNIQDLSSKVSDLAMLKKENKKDTVTIIKEKQADNNYNTTATATDDVSPLSEEKNLQDSTQEQVGKPVVAIAEQPIETKNADEVYKNEASKKMKDEEPAMKMKSLSVSKMATLPSANYANINDNNNAGLKPANVDEVEGLKQFNEKNYTKAIALLNNVIAKEPNEYQAKYYLGMSYFMSAKYIEAIKQFDAIMLSNNQDWYEDARYNKALAHLKINDNLTAKNLFEQIISENGKYKTEAQQQLDDLNK